jgi:hypothetical protein
VDGITVVTLATVVWKLVELVKNLLHLRWDPVVTQVVAWVGGIAVVLLAAQTSVASSVQVWGTSLDSLNGASLVLLGLGVSSFGGAAVEVKKALDNNDSGAQPTLFR